MQLLRTQAARFLGWDQETWDKGSSPEVAFIVWEMLSTDQRSAATILGYVAAGEFGCSSHHHTPTIRVLIRHHHALPRG
jgi:hypothetical protein